MRLQQRSQRGLCATATRIQIPNLSQDVEISTLPAASSDILKLLAVKPTKGLPPGLCTQNSADAHSTPLPNLASTQRGDRLLSGNAKSPTPLTPFVPAKVLEDTMQTRLVKKNATRKASICRLKRKHDDTPHSASGARRGSPPLGPPRLDAASGASARATDLAKASCANRRRHRSHILGWAQGVNEHPRLVRKGRKESRKETAAIKSGSERRITPSNRTQFALPPLFG